MEAQEMAIGHLSDMHFISIDFQCFSSPIGGARSIDGDGEYILENLGFLLISSGDRVGLI